MFSKKWIAVSFVVFSIQAFSAQKDPRIEYNRGGPDYAAVINSIAMLNKSETGNAEKLYKEAFELYKPAPPAISRIQLWQGLAGELDQEKRGALDEWLKANQPSISKIKQGSQMPFFWLTYPKGIPLGTGPLSTYTQVNSLANAICWQAKVKAVDGVTEDAMEDILAVYRFGQHIAAGPHTIAEQATGFNIQISALLTALQIIKNSDIDTASLEFFQKELQSLKDRQKFQFDLTASRLWLNDAMERSFTESGSVSQLHLDAMRLSLNLSPEDVARWQRLSESETDSQAKELFLFLESAMKKTPWELKIEALNIADRIQMLTAGNVLLENYRPDINTNFSLPFRCKAQTDAVITICGIKRFYGKTGKIPATLKMLVEGGYIKDEPRDPYNSGALTYFEMPKDFKLYSIGADFRDNFARPSKWGEGPLGGDEVFWPVP